MRRYNLNISDREFVVDVQEVDADNFEVVVGGETYQVSLSSDETLAEATITPGIASGAAIPTRSAAPVRREAARPAASAPASAAKRAPVGAGGKGVLTAPMPGVIIEVNVKPGDTVARGQQVAVLDAMKMHNIIGASQAGTIAEVYVEAGQNVDHGAPILKFQEE